MADREQHRFVYPFAEVAELYRKGAVDRDFVGPRHETLQGDSGYGRCWDTCGPDDFYGGSSEDVLGHLANGYSPPERALRGVPVTFEADGIAWKFNDEDGDYEHDLFISGEPDYYLDRRIVPQKPGIHVYVGIDFNCAVSVETVAAYGEWVASALHAISSLGYDISLNVTNTATSVYHGTHDDGTSFDGSDITEVVIQVKKFGEVVIPKDFLILFSRIGFRHLMFLAMTLEERNGLRSDGGLGVPLQSSEWGVDYDEDQRVLQITSNAQWGSKEFPAEDMDEQLREVAERF